MGALQVDAFVSGVRRDQNLERSRQRTVARVSSRTACESRPEYVRAVNPAATNRSRSQCAVSAYSVKITTCSPEPAVMPLGVRHSSTMRGHFDAVKARHHRSLLQSAADSCTPAARPRSSVQSAQQVCNVAALCLRISRALIDDAGFGSRLIVLALRVSLVSRVSRALMRPMRSDAATQCLRQCVQRRGRPLAVHHARQRPGSRGEVAIDER